MCKLRFKGTEPVSRSRASISSSATESGPPDTATTTPRASFSIACSVIKLLTLSKILLIANRSIARHTKEGKSKKGETRYTHFSLLYFLLLPFYLPTYSQCQGS